MEKKDSIVDYQIIEKCSQCGWKHEGDEEHNGVEIRKNRNDEKYFVCHLTKGKVFI